MSETAKSTEKPVGITCPNCAGDHVDLIGYSAFDENYDYARESPLPVHGAG